MSHKKVDIYENLIPRLSSDFSLHFPFFPDSASDRSHPYHHKLLELGGSGVLRNIRIPHSCSSNPPNPLLPLLLSFSEIWEETGFNGGAQQVRTPLLCRLGRIRFRSSSRRPGERAWSRRDSPHTSRGDKERERLKLIPLTITRDGPSPVAPGMGPFGFVSRARAELWLLFHCPGPRRALDFSSMGSSRVLIRGGPKGRPDSEPSLNILAHLPTPSLGGLEGRWMGRRDSLQVNNPALRDKNPIPPPLSAPSPKEERERSSFLSDWREGAL